MPIDFACTCGKKLRAKDGSSGRAFDCPACDNRVEVPGRGGVDLGIETAETVEIPRPRPSVAAAPAARHDRVQRVSVVDFDMPLVSLVWLLIKFEFAAVLAAIILLVPTWIVVGIFRAANGY